MTRTRGSMLIELSLTLSAGSVLTLLAIGTIHQTMRAASIARERCEVDRTLHRLATQFREDVHSSHAVDHVSDELTSMTFGEQSTIVYLMKPGSVQRVLKASDEKVVLEEYRLSVGARARLKLDKFEGDTPVDVPFERVVLTVSSQLPNANVPNRNDLHVVATLGSLRRIERGAVKP